MESVVLHYTKAVENSQYGTFAYGVHLTKNIDESINFWGVL